MIRANRSITSLETALDLAVWLEQAGAAFYEQAAAVTPDAALRTLFGELAAQERQHGAAYQRLHAETTGREYRHDQLLGEYGRFINLLVGEATRSLTGAVPTTRAELLAQALAFEKDTLLYFREITALFGSEPPVALDAICAEEQRHIAALLELGAA